MKKSEEWCKTNEERARQCIDVFERLGKSADSKAFSGVVAPDEKESLHSAVVFLRHSFDTLAENFIEKTGVEKPEPEIGYELLWKLLSSAFTLGKVAAVSTTNQLHFRKRHTDKPRAARINKNHAQDAAIEQAIRRAAVKKKIPLGELKAGEKFIELHLLDEIAAEMNLCADKLPGSRKLVGIVSRIKKESISD